MTEQISVNRELFDQVMVPNYAPSAIIPVRGQGSRVWDQNDNEYIAFAGGVCHHCLSAAAAAGDSVDDAVKAGLSATGDEHV